LPGATELVHGTCVALGRAAALLRGPSGSGKSDLALRFLFLAQRSPAAASTPILVADDQVCLVVHGARLLAKPPASIRGRLEVRGVGIIAVRFRREAELALIVDLVAKADIERLPERDTVARLLGVELPLLRLAAFEASAPVKLAVALARATRPRRCT
jgi:HPr kinase/phosphorylase